MTDIEKIRKLVQLQDLYNREHQINDMYKEPKKDLEKYSKENESLSSVKNELEINLKEMDRKITDELNKKEDINKRIRSLDDGKDKIKIARQLKVWEKEMEKMHQELGLIQAQIDYDLSKQAELKSEFEKITQKFEANNLKIANALSIVEKIKSENFDELEKIRIERDDINLGLGLQFSDYFQSMLEKTKGRAIVEVETVVIGANSTYDSCSGCNIQLPSIIQGDIGPNLKDEEIELHQCPHCFRFLYFREWV